MSNNANGSGPSWAVVILLIIFFWPIGLFLLIKKLAADKTATISSGGKGLKVTGIVLIVFASCGFLGFLSSATSYGMESADVAPLIALLFFAAGGVVCLRKANKIKKESKDIKQYLSIIVNGNVRQLDAIASTTGKSYNVVHKDIKNMIDKGYLKNAYIDEGMREVVLPNVAPVTTQNTVGTTVNTVTAKTKIVTCSCCGANNTITGDTGECEYCGSPLK